MELCFSKTLNPSSSLSPFLRPVKSGTLNLASPFLPGVSFPLQHLPRLSSRRNASQRFEVRALAGRSKKKPGGPSTGRIEGNAEVRRKIKQSAKRKTWRINEPNFYKQKDSHKNHPDNFTEDELNLIGLGYDRMVRFMEKDDPNLKHPYDWYKYGEYGPYSWRGVVIGEPIRGTIADECVSMMSETKSQEDWEEIEQHEMAVDFGERLSQLDKTVGLRRYWVFVRHPRWKLHELPWQQWTLVSEIVVQASKDHRIDKWNLMGRLGNKARRLIGQCAAWFRPDILYVKRPVFQCRFEPQEEFLKALVPLLDPETEKDCMFELKSEGGDGDPTFVTYFEGLCKIVRINQKAYVDDVVNAYQKMSDERKAECLEFLLENHPVQLLHPYTKEWKAKLEEMELGCDAPDEGEEDGIHNKEDMEFTEWIEDDGEDDVVMEMDEQDGSDDDAELSGDEGDESDGEDEEEDEDEEEGEEEEDPKYWEEKLEKALSSGEAMEDIVNESVKRSDAMYRKQLKAMERQAGEAEDDGGDETALRGKRAKVNPEEWKIAGIGKWRKRIKKSKIPPELFLRAAVRPFTYRNLVKEIVLTRHAILDGDIGRKKD